MLANSNPDPQLAGGNDPRMKIILPEGMDNFFSEYGYTPSLPDELRSNARLRVRSHADIVFTEAPPVLLEGFPGERARSGRVIISDLSRSGIGILYHEQIFPRESFQIRFQGRVLSAVAVRCRRLGECCFETGGTVTGIKSLKDD